VSFDLTTTFGIPPFSHHVAAKRNMIVDSMLEMTNVLIENNGAWHTTLVTLNKHVGALDL
jgi:hypothetical protein